MESFTCFTSCRSNTCHGFFPLIAWLFPLSLAYSLSPSSLPFHTAAQLTYFQKTKSTVRSFCSPRPIPCSLVTTPNSHTAREITGKPRQASRLPGSCGLLFSAPAADWLGAGGGAGREAGEMGGVGRGSGLGSGVCPREQELQGLASSL